MGSITVNRLIHQDKTGTKIDILMHIETIEAPCLHQALLRRQLVVRRGHQKRIVSHQDRLHRAILIGWDQPIGVMANVAMGEGDLLLRPRHEIEEVGSQM